MRRPLILVASMIMCTGWLFAEGTMHRKANGAVTMSAPIRVKDADGNAYRTVCHRQSDLDGRESAHHALPRWISDLPPRR